MAGQPGPYGMPPSPQRSPLPVIAGLLAIVTFLYLAYTSVMLILYITSPGLTLERVLLRTAYVIPWSGHGEQVFTLIVWLFTILTPITAILLFRRKPAGRTFGIVIAAMLLFTGVFELIALTPGYINAFTRFFPVIPLALLVLCVLPATGKAMGGARRQFAPQQFGYPQQNYPPPK